MQLLWSHYSKVIQKKLSQPHKKYLVVGMKRENVALQNHFFSIGLMPGRSITLIQNSPLGDPLIIEVQGSRWALRRADWNELDVVEQTQG